MIDLSEFFGLALRLARRRWWMHRIMPREDYEQEAMLALVLAGERFSETRGAKFSTFAYPAIGGALINAERTWLGWNRRTRNGPLFLPVSDDLDVPSHGMCDAEIEGLDGTYDGEWFARPARLYLLSGLSVLETARLCNCRPNTVHQAVSYFRRRLRQELAS